MVRARPGRRSPRLPLDAGVAVDSAEAADRENIVFAETDHAEKRDQGVGGGALLRPTGSVVVIDQAGVAHYVDIVRGGTPNRKQKT